MENQRRRQEHEIEHQIFPVDKSLLTPLWALQKTNGDPIGGSKTINRQTGAKKKFFRNGESWNKHEVIVREFLQNCLDACIRVSEINSNSSIITFNCKTHPNNEYDFLLNGRLAVRVWIDVEETRVVLNFLNIGDIMPVEALQDFSKKIENDDPNRNLKRQFICGGFGSGLKNTITALFNQDGCLKYSDCNFVTYHPDGTDEDPPKNFRAIRMASDKYKGNEGGLEQPKYTHDIQDFRTLTKNSILGLPNFLTDFDREIIGKIQQCNTACTLTKVTKSFVDDSRGKEKFITEIRNAFGDHIVTKSKEDFKHHFVIHDSSRNFIAEVYHLGSNTQQRTEKNVFYGFPGFRLCEKDYSNEHERKLCFNVNTNLITMSSDRTKSYGTLKFLIGKILCICLTQPENIKEIKDSRVVNSTMDHTNLFSDLITKSMREVESNFSDCITTYLGKYSDWSDCINVGMNNKFTLMTEQKNLKLLFVRKIKQILGKDCIFVSNTRDYQLLKYINYVNFCYIQAGMEKLLNCNNTNELLQEKVEEWFLKLFPLSMMGFSLSMMGTVSSSSQPSTGTVSSSSSSSQPSTGTVSSSSPPSRPWYLDVFCYPDSLQISVIDREECVFEDKFNYLARIIKNDGKLHLFLRHGELESLRKNQDLVEKIFFLSLGKKDPHSRKKTMEIFGNEKKRKG